MLGRRGVQNHGIILGYRFLKSAELFTSILEICMDCLVPYGETFIIMGTIVENCCRITVKPLTAGTFRFALTGGCNFRAY